MAGERIPPTSIEAEQSVLGCMIISENAVAAACAGLSAEDFYSPAHREIFEAAYNLYSKGKHSDLITITAELRSRGSLEGIGGISYLMELSQLIPGAGNVDAYIKIVAEKATMRKLIDATLKISDAAYDQSLEANEAVNFAEQTIFDITQHETGKGFIHLPDKLISVYDSIEENYTDRRTVTGIPTGFIELDEKTSGLHGSELILVAARPSMGKSSFVMNITMNAALRAGKKVAFFTLEDSAEQLVSRMLCSEAMVDLQRVRTGNLADDDFSKLLMAMNNMQKADIYIDDTPGQSVMDIRSKSRRLSMEKGLDMIAIDYLQLMSAGPGAGDNRQSQITEMTRSLKGLARELNVPVIVLSQLNRAVEQRPDHKPMMSDLRESGAIEQDADLIMFLYREAYYDTNADNTTEINLAKQRNGPTGTVKLLWQREYTRFMNPAASWQENSAPATN